MRQALNLDRTYIKPITDHAMAPRHGEHKSLPVEIDTMLLLRAWTIMDRYLHYRQNGQSAPLLEKDFPILKG